jgi:hypothetical protein
MTDLQELMALPEIWRTNAEHDLACGFHSSAAAYRLCATELETFLRSPAFAEMAAVYEAWKAAPVAEVEPHDEWGHQCPMITAPGGLLVGQRFRLVIDAQRHGRGEPGK